MRAIIVIECDEDNEVVAHLDVVKKQLKKEIIKRRKTNDETDFSVKDDNCYGSHRGTVIHDDEQVVEISGIYYY